VQDHITGKNRFVQDSEEMLCTYDEVAHVCRECNQTRAKVCVFLWVGGWVGHGLTVLPPFYCFLLPLFYFFLHFS
jgi:hypothetical protein